MSVPPTVVTPELEKLADGRSAEEMLDVIVELEQDPGESQSIAKMQESFVRKKEPVDKRISELGGTVMEGAWINSTVRARVPVGGLADLSQLPAVRALDVPHKLEAD